MIWGICRKILLQCPIFHVLISCFYTFSLIIRNFVAYQELFSKSGTPKLSHFYIMFVITWHFNMIFLYMPQNSTNRKKTGCKATHFQIKRGNFIEKSDIRHIFSQKINLPEVRWTSGDYFFYIIVNAMVTSKNNTTRNPTTTNIGLNMNFTADQ